MNTFKSKSKGWDGLSPVSTNKENFTPTEDELQIYAAFSGKNGEKVLDILMKWTIGNPSLRQVSSDGMNTAMMMAMHEGENNLVRKILHIIKKVKDVG